MIGIPEKLVEDDIPVLTGFCQLFRIVSEDVLTLSQKYWPGNCAKKCGHFFVEIWGTNWTVGHEGKVLPYQLEGHLDPSALGVVCSWFLLLDWMN